MRIAVIGALEGPEEVTRRRFRAPGDPFDHDVLLLDARGAWAEYAPLVERDGPPPTLSIAGGDALQRDCRAWQAVLDAHVKGGGLLAVLAAEVPVLGVHTLDRVQTWNALAASPLPVATAGPVAGGPWQAIGGAPLRDFARALLPFFAPTVALQGGTPLVREAAGHRAVAVHGSLGAGRILVLPATMAGMTNGWDTVAAAFRRLSDSMTLSREGATPRWIDREVLADEQPHHLELARIGREQAALAARAERVKATLSGLRLRRALAHARSRPFVDAAAEAFWFLGCSVQQGPEGDHDLIVLAGC